MPFFDDFTLTSIDLPRGPIRLRHGGSGPPLLLLHGNPQTHAMWNAIAPDLAQTYTVYAPDLRGYGGSVKPPATEDHSPYSKREMALDLIALMEHFGHAQFRVAAHDRGARVAHRMALDHPDAVQKLCLMDIVPTLEHFERADMDFAMAYSHWFWLAQPHPIPEDMMNDNPSRWFHGHIRRAPDADNFFHEQAEADYLNALQDPNTIRGICEDYRAAASIDLVHDRDSRRIGHRIQCPLHVLWGTKGIIGKFYNPLDLWQQYCDAKVTGHEVHSGHYLPEENPTKVLGSLIDFLR